MVNVNELNENIKSFGSVVQGINEAKETFAKLEQLGKEQIAIVEKVTLLLKHTEKIEAEQEEKIKTLEGKLESNTKGLETIIKDGIESNKTLYSNGINALEKTIERNFYSYIEKIEEMTKSMQESMDILQQKHEKIIVEQIYEIKKDIMSSNEKLSVKLDKKIEILSVEIQCKSNKLFIIGGTTIVLLSIAIILMIIQLF